MLSSNSSRGHGHEHHHHDPSHHHQDSLHIKQNDKFFSRLISKDTSMANSSSRVYYRSDASSSVPFMWESRPGTPKHTSIDTTLPPLTPPPSYLSRSGSKTNNNNVSKNLSGTKLLTSINVFPRIVVKKKKKNSNNNVTPSSSWSSKSSSLSSSSSSSSSSTLSWSSSSCYSFSSGSKLHNDNNVLQYIDNDHDGDQRACHQDYDHGYPTSTTCFGGKDRSFNGSSRGRYSMEKMKNALRSIVGHGPSGH